MEAVAAKRKLNESEQEVGASQSSVGKYIVSASPIVCSPENESKENNTVVVEGRPVIVSRTISIPHLKLVTLTPMNKTVSPNKNVVSVTPTSGGSDGQTPRRFRYASLNTNNLKRPPIRPDISVTSSVGTQTTPSYLRDSLANKQQQLNANKTDMFAICSWCGQTGKNIVKCERCNHAFDQETKMYSPGQTPVKVATKAIQPATTTTIATILPQAIVITPQEGRTALLATPTVIKTGQFYGQQISIQSTTRVIPQTPNGASKVWVMGKQPTPVKKYRSKKKVEPECLTISSDEEESQSPSKNSQTPEKPLASSTPKDGSQGPDLNESVLNRSTVIHSVVKTEDGSSRTESGEAQDEETILIKCRSIRIGSYKVQAYEPQTLSVTVTSNEFQFTVTTIDGTRPVNLAIQKQDIPSVLAHFGKVLPVLFIYTTPACGGIIRTQLNMTTKEKPYYDPCSSEEPMKRITILPIQLNDQQKVFLSHKFPGQQLAEIKQTVANEILIRSTPVNQATICLGVTVTRPEIRSQVVIAQPPQAKVTKEVIKLVTYPPPPQTGGIEINSEDLECLNEGEFLNDVIIDFYLKYLINEKLSPADRQQTHIFSSFFFPRLTTKNTDEETTVNIIRRRHARVKTWTRHVDIFEKDFIVVPINQNSHWFLAVICFPGMQPPGDVGKNEKGETAAKTLQDSPEVEEECEPSPSQCSPAESMTSEPMETDDLENPLPPVAPACPMTVPLPGLDDEKKSTQPTATSSCTSESRDKGPCILIFDSLPGNQRWKVVQTLREYLTIEYETKKKEPRIFDRTTMRGVNVTLLPRQENYTDCGIYLLQYVESFFESPLKKFSSPLPSLLDWFPDSKIAGKRMELKELILSLQRQQQENSAARDGGSAKNGQPEKSI